MRVSCTQNIYIEPLLYLLGLLSPANIILSYFFNACILFPFFEIKKNNAASDKSDANKQLFLPSLSDKEE